MESVQKLIEEASALALVGAKDRGVRVRFAFGTASDLVLADKVQVLFYGGSIDIRAQFESLRADGSITMKFIGLDDLPAGMEKIKQNVINTINKMTHYTAGGISPGIDWTQQHTNPGPIDCNAFLQVQQGRFTSVFGNGKNPFVCFQSPNPTTMNPVPFPNDPNTFFNSTQPTPKTS